MYCLRLVPPTTVSQYCLCSVPSLCIQTVSVQYRLCVSKLSLFSTVSVYPNCLCSVPSLCIQTVSVQYRLCVSKLSLFSTVSVYPNCLCSVPSLCIQTVSVWFHFQTLALPVLMATYGCKMVKQSLREEWRSVETIILEPSVLWAGMKMMHKLLVASWATQERVS